MLIPKLLRYPIVLSVLIVVVYALSAWIWFGSSSTSMAGSFLFFPFVIVFAVGYGEGETMGWIALFGQLFLMWLLVFAVARSWPRA